MKEHKPVPSWSSAEDEALSATSSSAVMMMLVLMVRMKMWHWTYLSKTSRIINMQNAKGHARYRSSACGKVDSSVFFKSAQVTLCGSQNLSFQNHTRIPAISSGSDALTPVLMCSQWPMRLCDALSRLIFAGPVCDDDDDVGDDGPPVLCCESPLSPM